MRHEKLEAAGLDYAVCRYGGSRLLFRGPKRPTDKPYITFVGGTDVFGKYVERPLPALVEREIKRSCVNLGVPNGSVDVQLNDPTMMELCRRAELSVIQITGAQNLSNRFYRVHPRRNDRLIEASTVMRALYPDIDFTEYSFTRHMLSALFLKSPKRFATIQAELELAWLSRMRTMLTTVGRRVVLLWWSDRPLTNAPWYQRSDPFRGDPMFITRSMVQMLRPLVKGIVEVEPMVPDGCAGLIVPDGEMPAAAERLPVSAHAIAAQKIVPLINRP